MGSAVADPDAFTPARFTAGEFSLQRLIEYPDLEEDGLNLVHCTMEVYASGVIARNVCYSSRSVHHRFYESIRPAVLKAKMTPAMVDGEARRVLLNYRVAFLKRDETSTIGVYPNWGHDVERYGTNYDAPQRYTERMFPVVCYRYQNWLKMTIAEDGTIASEVEFRFKDGSEWRSCHSTLRQLHERAKYIPGHHEGEPVASIYEESWGRSDEIRLE